MPEDLINSFMTGPDEAKGASAIFGGRFVSAKP
jgi:hypothetical protein